MSVETQSYYNPDSGDAPTAHGWTTEGTAGVLVDDRWWSITAIAAEGYLWRPADAADPTPLRVDDRLEIEVAFRGTQLAPGGGWSQYSAHLLVLDDGERAIGLSIGDRLAFVNPNTGAVYLEIASSWGWAGLASYQLIKVNRSSWEAWVDGRLIGRLAYNAVPEGNTILPNAGHAWGWFDGSGSGQARWGHVETGLNRVLPPDAVVDRTRLQMAAQVQANWNARWRAMTRAMVGLLHGAGDVSRRAYDDFTAAQIPWKTAEFDGDSDARNVGWTYLDPTTISNVRERIRFVPSTTTNYVAFDFGNPTNPSEAVYYARATFTLRDWVSSDPNHRVGPFLAIADGARSLAAYLVAQDGNPEALGWVISDAPPTGGLGNTGDRFARVNAYEPHVVELVAIARERVILFVDGRIVEDIPADRFTTVAATTLALVGRSGSADIACTVDAEDAFAYVAYADNGLRPWFVQRLSERLVFVSGCERNDRLDQWNRHRHGVYEVRGTDLVLSEIRRVACDDAAELVTIQTPADWFLEVSYPEVTPIFIDSNGFVYDVALEFEAGSPNFPPATLKRLIETYLLPVSVVEAQYRALLRTFLTTNAGTVGDETSFEVGSVSGFAVGDVVELRHEITGALLELEYDVGILRTDRGIRDTSENGRHGTPLGSGTLENVEIDGLSTAVLKAANPGVSGGRIRVAVSPALAGGLTYAGWFRWHNVASVLVASATESPLTTGGWTIRKAANNHIQLEMYTAAGASIGSIDVNPGAIVTGTWVHLAFVYDPAAAGAELELYVNGVSAGTAAQGAAPGIASGGVAVGGSWADGWWHDHRDHWVWERALGTPELAALVATTRMLPPRNTFEQDTADEPWLVFLRDGYAAAIARYEPDALLPELQYVESFDDRVWSPWFALVDGQKRREVDGLIGVTGLGNDRLANITAGSTVTVVGDSAAAVGWVEVFGRAQGTGTATRERLQLNGVTPVVGTVLWAASGVHGGTLDRNAGDEVRIRDTVAAVDLYVIAVGARASGVHLFDPPLRAGSVTLRYRATGAGTETFLVAGHVVGSGDALHPETLAGVVLQEGAEEWVTIRALPMGYVPNARTVLLDAVLTDTAGELTLVSNDAADEMSVFAIGLGADGSAFVDRLTLDGLTPTTGASGYVRFLGLATSGLGAGTVTVSLIGGSVDVSIGSFDSALTDSFGGRKLTAGMVGAVELAPSDDLSGVVGVFGRDESGAVVAAAVTLGDADSWEATTDWVELRGIFTGDIERTSWVTARGTAWRGDGPYAAVQAFSGFLGWQGTLQGALDARLDDNTPQDLAEFVPVELLGRGSTYEMTEILAIDTTTNEVTVPEVAGTFTTGDVMRKSAIT